MICFFFVLARPVIMFALWAFYSPLNEKNAFHVINFLPATGYTHTHHTPLCFKEKTLSRRDSLFGPAGVSASGKKFLKHWDRSIRVHGCTDVWDGSKNIEGKSDFLAPGGTKISISQGEWGGAGGNNAYAVSSKNTVSNLLCSVG